MRHNRAVHVRWKVPVRWAIPGYSHRYPQHAAFQEPTICLFETESCSHLEVYWYEHKFVASKKLQPKLNSFMYYDCFVGNMAEDVTLVCLPFCWFQSLSRDFSPTMTPQYSSVSRMQLLNYVLSLSSNSQPGCQYKFVIGTPSQEPVYAQG